jgi:hypothetical protein
MAQLFKLSNSFVYRTRSSNRDMIIEVAAAAWLTLALLEDNGKLYLTDP